MGTAASPSSLNTQNKKKNCLKDARLIFWAAKIPKIVVYKNIINLHLQVSFSKGGRVFEIFPKIKSGPTSFAWNDLYVRKHSRQGLEFHL